MGWLLAPVALPAQMLTQVSDTLYNADGTTASGRVVIAWDPFTTADSSTIDGGTLSYTIPASGVEAGKVAVSLAPNVGATPSGTSYRVRYYLANGASYTETWVVPATGPVAIRDVRVTVPPTPSLTINGSTQLTGVVPLANGGTNQTVWTADRCVRVNSTGDGLESAAADCGTGGGGGGGHTIEEEGSPLTQRGNLNFVGAAVTATDDPGNDRTDVTVVVDDSTVPNTITLDDITQVTARNYSDLQDIPSTFAPSAHASSHQDGGADEIATATPGANAIPKAQAGGTLADGWLPSGITRDAEVNVQGTANEISSSGSGVAPTLSLPTRIDLGGKTSFEVPNGAVPVTDSFGEIAGDDNAWAAGRGTVQAYDGTANTYLVGVLASDAPANGQVPKWNTGGTITWEDDATGAGGGDAVSVNSTGVTDADLDDATPAPPAGGVNVKWQTSGGGPADISAYVPVAPNGSTTVVGTGRSLTGGAGIAAIGDLSADRTISTASGEANFLASGALACGAGMQGKAQVHTTPLQYCDNTATPALQYAAYGDSTGNALAGDSATAFFSTGTLEDARLSANVSLLGPDIGLGLEVSGILPGANGGTGNGFFGVTGPTTTLKTYTFPNASATVLTTNAAVTIPQGGTGGAPGADDQALISDSTSAATWRTLPNGAVSYATATNSLAQAGISNLAGSSSADLAGVLSDETGSGGGFVRASSPTLTTPTIASIVNTGTLSLPTSTDTLVGRATTDTLTNKTLNAESTGNTLTTVEKIALVAAGCNNTTAAPGWDVPTSNGPAASCYGTSPQRFGGLDFPDGATALTSTSHLRLPSDWSGIIDATFLWFSGSTSTNSAVWTLATSCVADAEGLLSPSFNTTQTVSDANNASANTRNSASIASITTTGCAPGEMLFLRIGRDPTNGSDTLAATASLLEFEVTLRRAQ